MTFPRIFQSGRTALLWLLCCALPVSGLRAAAVPLAGIETDPHSKVDMRVTTAFKELTPTGFATLQIYVHNSSGQARSWLFHFDSSGGGEDRYQSSRQITVPDNAEQTFEVLVPLLAGDSQNFYSSLSINVSGYGLAGTSSSLSSNSSSGSTTDYLLMSTSLYTRSWGPLEKACSDRGTELIGSEFDPNYLPTDWRGYLGVGTMLITDTEFHDLDPVLRNAIHEWVLQGGSLVICSTTQHQPGDFGYHDEHPGYGHLKLVQWDGRELDAGVAMPLILARDHSVAANVSNGYNTRWSLAGAIGKLQFNGTFIMLFVVCFGLVIGPMNLFRFAKSGQRHKLFWTTPAISIAGSIVLALVIYLQDGLGGTGKRMTLVQLVTGENDAIVTQEQISRTGLLISSGFKTEDKVFISPIYNLPASTSAEWVGVKNQSRTYNQDGNSESGGWFVSRSVQGQLLQVIRPSRSRMDLETDAGGAPVLHSSIENDLQQVFYIDSAGKYWKSGGVIRVGEKQALVPATETDFDAWAGANTGDAGARIDYQFRQAAKRRGYFYAVADSPGNDAIATLPSIHWSNAKAIYLGPCGEAATPKP